MHRAPGRVRAAVYAASKSIALKAFLLSLAAFYLGGQQTPTKEYIRLGDRVIAIENPTSSTISILATPTTTGAADPVQLTATLTPPCSTCVVTWSSTNNLGSFTDSGTAQTASFAPPSVTSPTTVVITASILSGTASANILVIRS